MRVFRRRNVSAATIRCFQSELITCLESVVEFGVNFPRREAVLIAATKWVRLAATQ